MPLSLIDVRRIATAVASEHDMTLQVVGARAANGSPYTEIFLSIRGCSEQPCELVIGASREVSEAKFRDAVRERLREQISERSGFVSG